MKEIFAAFSGVLLNTGTVLLGGTLGLLFHKGIPARFSDAIMKAIGLCTLAIGITGVMKSENQLVMILSLVAGTALGTLLQLDKRLEHVGERLGKRQKKGGSGASFSEGFVSASLLFCVGAMTIVGSLSAGLSGDNEMLYTKSILDLISSCMLAASLGAGVLCAAAFVFVFQGGLVLLAMLFGTVLTDFMIAEIIAAGSVMILALGLNLIGVTKLRVANLLPGLLFVPVFCLLAGLLPF